MRGRKSSRAYKSSETRYLDQVVESDDERAIFLAAARARGVTDITDNLRVDNGEIDWDDPQAILDSQVRNERS